MLAFADVLDLLVHEFAGLVDADFPSRLSLFALAMVFFSGMSGLLWAVDQGTRMANASGVSCGGSPSPSGWSGCAGGSCGRSFEGSVPGVSGLGREGCSSGITGDLPGDSGRWGLCMIGKTPDVGD